MQTKKVAMVRNSSKALASPKATKTKKKVQEDVDNQENRVSQIITSSARKQKPGNCGVLGDPLNVSTKKLKLSV
nr:CTD small phosphatase-like protein 2 isoform X1 [Tanacetum cinerariifolium]